MPSEKLKRIITAAILLPIFYLYIKLLPPAYFLILLCIASVLAQVELYSMYKTKRSLSLLGSFCGALLILSPMLVKGNPFLASGIITVLSFMLISSTRLFIIKDPIPSLKDISPVIVGFLYIPSLLLTQWFLRLRGYEWIILLYGCVWASDSVAYFIGKGFGKRKLYREVSPNKTVAGAFGSVIGGAISAYLIGNWLLMNGYNIKTPVLLMIGIAIGVVTIVGDLVESMFKRDAGVKDSGSLIPGHGGVLDKIDGVLFAGPVLYWITLML